MEISPDSRKITLKVLIRVLFFYYNIPEHEAFYFNLIITSVPSAMLIQ